jgi:hypothetical protein
MDRAPDSRRNEYRYTEQPSDEYLPGRADNHTSLDPLGRLYDELPLIGSESTQRPPAKASVPPSPEIRPDPVKFKPTNGPKDLGLPWLTHRLDINQRTAEDLTRYTSTRLQIYRDFINQANKDVELLNELLGQISHNAPSASPIADAARGVVDYRSRGQNREKWGAIRNDDLDSASLEMFLQTVFQNVANVCREGATAYVFHGISMAGIRIAFERAFLSAGFRLSSTIVWAKQSASMGWSDYREQHEAILYGWIGDGHRRIRDRTQTTVWQIDRESNYQHPTQKPVALISRALRNSTLRSECVLDPFVGSGTTLIACEQLGRRCFAVDIDPKYCDVAVQRWEAYTGKKAELVREGPASSGEVKGYNGHG